MDGYERLKRAAVCLLADQSLEGQTLLSLLVDTEVHGDPLMVAIESAEQYVQEKGETL